MVDPKHSHIKAVRYLVCYLIGTRDKGYYINPNNFKGLNVHVDTGFSGNWDNTESELDYDTTRSRHVYIISYMDLLII